ncbi:MAG: hypothetical protein WBM67_10455 [Sedimenticolaceae bacterium]
MLDGIIRSRRSNGQKIDLKLSQNGHGLPFDKHLTTGSFMHSRRWWFDPTASAMDWLPVMNRGIPLDCSFLIS